MSRQSERSKKHAIDFQDIEQLLSISFQDQQLSSAEKRSFEQLFSVLSQMPESLNFVRNKAFELVRAQSLINPSSQLNGLKWLEDLLKTLDRIRNQNLTIQNQAFFSPGLEPINKIIGMIETAQSAIDVCVFTISDNRIAEALLLAFQRGVKIRIITDDDKIHDTGSDIVSLMEKGITVKVDHSPSHMHHKFAIFDKQKIVSGSFNWTRSATQENQENIIVSDDPHLVDQFRQQFKLLWAQFSVLDLDSDFNKHRSS